MDCTSANSSKRTTISYSGLSNIHSDKNYNNTSNSAAVTKATKASGSVVVVHFGSVVVMEMEQILGDHPAVSSGPPLALGWTLISKQYHQTVDVFEQQQQQQQRHDQEQDQAIEERTTTSASPSSLRQKQQQRQLDRIDSCFFNGRQQRSSRPLYLEHFDRVKR
jgi:hypothetical protein